MAILIFGVLMVLLGVTIELSMGSFDHWMDWSWPKRRHPVGGAWVKVICGRIGTILGVAAIIFGGLEVMTRS
jgi:hypothetical protein